MPRPAPHSQNLRCYRRMDMPGVWFITKSLWPKRSCLIDVGFGELIVDTLRFMAEQGRIILAAFVVMPNHWHALFACGDYETSPDGTVSPNDAGLSNALPEVMHSMNTWIGGKTSAKLISHGTAWEDGYYDTRIRSSRQFGFVLNYIEENPVERDLVSRPEEWPYSSANPMHTGMLLRPWPWKFEQDDR